MPPGITNRYLVEKYKHEGRFENYVADCIWASATGMIFQSKDKKPAYPRWSEIVRPSHRKLSLTEEVPVTKETVKTMFARLKTGKNENSPF